MGRSKARKTSNKCGAVLADMREKHLASAVQVLTPQQREQFAKMKGPKINLDLSKI